MKFLASMALGIALIVGTSSLASAEQGQQHVDSTVVTVDLKDLGSDTVNAILYAKKQADKTSQSSIVVPKVEDVKEWASIGTMIGDSISATAKSLSVSVNDFIKTPVGMMVLFLIFFKVVGASVWQIFAGTIFLTIFGTAWWKSYKYYLIPWVLTEKTFDKDGLVTSTTETLESYPFSRDGKAGAVFFHIASLIVLFAVGLIIVF